MMIMQLYDVTDNDIDNDNNDTIIDPDIVDQEQT